MTVIFKLYTKECVYVSYSLLTLRLYLDTVSIHFYANLRTVRITKNGSAPIADATLL